MFTVGYGCAKLFLAKRLSIRVLITRVYITNITGNEKIDAEKLISQLFQGSLILKIKGTDNVITERM